VVNNYLLGEDYPAFDLLHTLAKFHALGMELPDLVACATVNAARAIRRPDLGTLQPGVGVAVRKYVLMRRGLLTHDALRQPGAALGATARAEVDYLLQRVARVDPRARL
ncbi:MAG: hypothetical protein ACO2Z8_01760, partial [Burkholderiaceae bacterium]